MTDLSSQPSSGSAAVSDDADELARDVGALRDDVSRLSDSVAQLVKLQAQEGVAVVRDAVSVAHDTLNEQAGIISRAGSGLADDARQRFSTMGDELKASIQRAPIASVLIAATAGMIYGMIRR